MEFYRITKDSPRWQLIAYDYVRTDAFCFGQNIPIETEFSHDAPIDELNGIVVIDGHKPVAGCRLSYPAPGVGKIERVCVIRQAQTSGIGSLMLAQAERWIAEQGIRHIVISSQDRAVGFYQKNGYVINPDVSPDAYETHPHPGGPSPDSVDFKPDFICFLVEKYLDGPESAAKA